MEIWKDITDYIGIYQVSNLGRVKSQQRFVRNKHSVRPVNERILKQSIGNSGYYYVNLSKKQIDKSKDVHRIVALEFLGHEYSNLTVNHKDGNKLNNNINNLEFVTQAENNRHSRKDLGQTRCYDRSGSKNPMFGRKHSKETRNKLSVARKKYIKKIA